MIVFRYLIAICLCLLFVPAVEAGPLANIRAKIKAVLHHGPTPAPGVTADKPDCQSCKAKHSVLVPHQDAPKAPAEVEPPKKTAAKGASYQVPDPCNCGETGICNCKPGKCKCEDCPRKKGL